MRILVNAVGARMGGAARHLLPFVAALTKARADWELTICLAAGDEGVIEGIRTVDVLHPAKAGPLSRLRWDAHGAESLAKRLDANVILNLTNYGPLAPGRPSVIFQRNPIYFDPFWIKRSGFKHQQVAGLRRRLAFAELRRSSAVVTPTQAMLDYLRAWPPCTLPTRAAVIHHAVDTERFSFVARRSGRLTSVRLLMVGHAAPHKGIETAINCVSHLGRLGVMAELQLTVALTGNGSSQRYVDMLVRLAKRLRVENQIDWLGSRTDVETLYHQADILMFPSFSESFGFPLLEAMATGTPIVSSAIPSSIEVAGSSAVYFVPGNGETAAASVVGVLERPEAAVRESLGNARLLAESMSWSRNASAVAELLEEVSAPGRWPDHPDTRRVG